MLKRLNILLVLAFVASTVLGQTTYQEAVSGLGFGGTISFSDGEIVVGSAATGWPRGDEPAGAVFLYQKQDGQWTETGSLTASDGGVGDDYGRTVFMQGSTLVVGSPGEDAAYVYTKGSDGAWAESTKLMPSAMEEGYEFGGAYARAGGRTGNIAMAGNQIAVTSFNSESNSGRVHVFRSDGGTWSEVAVLSSGLEGDGFARSIVGTEGTLFAGAPLANEGEGKVYMFMDHGSWSQVGTIEIEAEGSPGLGSAMAVSERRLYVSALAYERTGAVLVFEPESMHAFKQVNVIQPPAAEEGERGTFRFGTGIATSGSEVLITAAGSAHVYRSDGSLAAFGAPNVRSTPGFGTGIAFSGDTVVIGSPSADYEAGVASVFERDGDSWAYAGLLASDVSHLDSYSGDKVDCEDGEANGFSCDNVDLVSFMNIGDVSSERGVGMTDIWGWEDPETGKEWVLLGRTEGVSFVDISDPSNPVWVGELLKTEGSPGSGWRDVKVYKDHAFVVADGAEAHGMQIFDLTQLRDVDAADMPVTFSETAHYAGTNSTHNVVINEETGFAFAVGNRSGGETCGGQLHMINVQDPANPTFAGCFSLDEAGGTHDSQCVIYRGEDPDYHGREICLNSSGNMFVIADVTDKENPVTLASTSYPNQAYTHQGWLSEDHNYFFMNDELDEMGGLTENTRTLIWDVRDLEDPTLAKEFYLDSPASDHNLYIRDNFMYQSNYQAGLRILDVSDAENPVEVGHFDTVPFGDDAAGFGGSWSNYPYFKSGVIAISSRGEGLFLVRKREIDI